MPLELFGVSSADVALQNTERDHSTATRAAQAATRRMKSADSSSGDGWDDPNDGGVLLPAYAPESRTGRSSPAAWDAHSHQNGADYTVAGPLTEEDSKWIHRDKLAKIENEELQAAGLYVPRSRAPSKQGRDRSRSAMRRGTDASERSQVRSRSRKNSASLEQRAAEVVVQPWDLRTPEEIAEEEANAYFISNSLNGSRIPVAKTSPAPINFDSSQNGDNQSEGSSETPITKTQTGSRSASRTRADGDRSTASSTAAGKRPDASPKKNGTRKTTAPPRSGPPTTRPKTRSGSGSNNTRPSTRSGESPPVKPMEGDPPWMVNSYQPDPRLPPDQQLLPTVAKRLQQEKWEKEGTYGDTYDKEFRPLNDKAWLKPTEGEKAAEEEENQQQQQPGDEWPLKPEQIAKSPSLRQSSYSTMPKISDKPPGTPVGSPRPPMTPQMSSNHVPQLHQQQPQQQEQQLQHPQVPEDKDDDEPKQKGGCGCCVVM